MLAGLGSALSVTMVAGAQTGAAGTAAKTAPAPALQLQNLDPATVQKDPFPPVNAKYFTATSPTVDTVNTFLKALWGYDANRIWRVEAIQKTPAPDVSKVIVFLSDKTPNAKVQTTAFFVTPDQKHAIAGDAVIPFGATPFAELRKTLEERADGAARGAAGKDLLLVEFADMQCPHCKDAQGTMESTGEGLPECAGGLSELPAGGDSSVCVQGGGVRLLRRKAEERGVLSVCGGGVRYAERSDGGDRRTRR